MSSAQATKEEIVGLIKGLQDRVTKAVTPIEGLMRMAKEPASRAGVKPEEWLLGYFKNGTAFFDNYSHLRKSHRGRRRKSYLGRGERADGKPGSFGEYLKALHDFHDSERQAPDARMEASRVLKSYGQQQWQYKGMDWVKKSDMLESSAVSGGYLVAPQYDQQLYEIAMEDTIVDKYARQHPMTSRTLVINGLDQVNETFAAQAGYTNMAGGMKWWWAAEGATRKQTAPNFRQILLNANELSFYAALSNTVMQDVDAIDSIVTQLCGRVVGFGYDYACIRGNGVGQPLGVQNANCQITVTRQTANTITYTDITNLYNHVYFQTRNEDLVWLAHPSCMSQILQLNDQSGYTSGTGRLIFQPIDQGAQADIEESDGPRGFGFLLGKKLILTEKCPPAGSTGDLGLYDFSTYAQGRRMDMEIMWSPHVQFLQNSSVVRIVLRVDGQPLLGRKITYADAGTYASPFVLLDSST